MHEVAPMAVVANTDMSERKDRWAIERVQYGDRNVFRFTWCDTIEDQNAVVGALCEQFGATVRDIFSPDEYVAEITVRGINITLIGDPMAGFYFYSQSPEHDSIADQLAMELERYLSGDPVEPL